MGLYNKFQHKSNQRHGFFEKVELLRNQFCAFSEIALHFLYSTTYEHAIGSNVDGPLPFLACRQPRTPKLRAL